MCSLFVPSTRIMENYQGDLTDILRAGAAAAAATGGPYGCSGGAEVADHNQDPNINAAVDWLHFPSDHSMKFSSPSAMEEEEPRDNFGDPFCSYMRDPLLHELDLSGSVSTGFFSGPISSQMTNISAHHHHVDEVVTSTTSAAAFAFGPHQVDQISKRPCNIFSPMLQISPSGGAAVVSPCDSPVMGAAASPRGVNKGSLSAAAAAMLPSDMINGNSSKGCLLDNTGGGMQISSPRNPGIKRRKSQAKKVVCIPAPAAANSRPTGEVVPSDLWAWRKYGQKPIKGSPYPRGYYRCSSSKGCSARKQVERSRTDPNMLVITYTSEHNHPWPTQRNALAGSTRSQPSKSSAASKTSPSHHSQPQQKTSSPKEEQRGESMNEHNGMSSTSSTTVSASHVKEEVEDIEKQLEVHHHDHHHDHSDHHHQFMSTDHHHDQGFPYRPSMPNDVDHDHHQCNSNINNHQSQSHHEDFFADLGELEADPLNLLFSQCFTADEQQQQKGGSKASEASALDPFSLFDWSEDNNNNTTTSFGDQAKRRL